MSDPSAQRNKRTARFYGLLLEPQAPQEEARRRELALNLLLIVLLGLALLVACQRALQIAAGGPETPDHVHTLLVATGAAVAFGLLWWLSRQRNPATASWWLLGVLYAVTAWSMVAEGPGKSTTVLICALFVVAAGALCGRAYAVRAVVLVGATLVLVAILFSAGVLTAPKESSPAVPDMMGVVEIAGALGAIALLLAVGTQRVPASEAARLDSNSDHTSEQGARGAGLTVRERQVVRLIALGHTDAEISAELTVSPRTVHSHVSSALHKTSCANRTELAVLAVREGLADPETA